MYVPHHGFPLQHPISVTPAAGRRDACLHVYPAACGLCMDRHALGMWALTHRSFSRIALPTHKLFVHIGSD